MKKSSKIIITLLILILIAVLGFGGYFIWKLNDKVAEQDNKIATLEDSNGNSASIENSIQNEVVTDYNNSVSNETSNSETYSTNSNNTELTSSELEEIQTFLNEEENNPFIACTYTSVSEINLSTIFWDKGKTVTTDEEINAFLELNVVEEVYTDLMKITTSNAQKIYQEKTGKTISKEELIERLNNGDSWDTWFYLEEYDAFYSMHGDALEENLVMCDSGYKTSDNKYVIKLYESDYEYETEDAWQYYSTVTLQKSGSTYLFVSNV